MEWPKLKNIIILILALVNLFLLAMLGLQERGAVQDQEQAIADTISVLERNGIQMDSDNVPAELELTTMTVERDLESEAVLAQALLGECEVQDLGSGRYAYQSARGMAEFRSNGNFSFAFYEGQRWREEELANVLDAMAEGGFVGTVVSQNTGENPMTLTLCQNWQDVLVYSCQAEVTFEDGHLVSVVGQRLMGTPQSENDKTQLISVPTALLKILNEINDMGDICNEITSMTPGYVLTVSADRGRMIPVWYVTTDTGAYSLNAVTGVLERD